MTDSILIVDDSLTVRMDLAEAFRSAGFRPVPCGTAGEAREALSREPVSLVVLDVLLPDADGVAFLQEIRSTPASAHTPVLLLSTESEVRDRIRGLTTGADEYVGKPYDTSYVVARIRELLRRREGSPAQAGPTVLVVDDSLTFRNELEQALQTHGYQVLAASSGEEALRIAADARPSAVIVDGVLPGIDGATVVRRIRLDAALRRTPCLLLTGAEDRGAELKALDAGADAFVRKGEDLDLVLARLGAVVRSAGAAAGVEATASLLGPKKVLAVDDSVTYLQGLAAALREEGYDVVLARSGEEALELLAVQPVDCILLDLLMPGIGGKETCSRIKATPAMREIPLIMLTALEEREAMIEGLSAGADDYIAKSADFQVLKARVLAQIRRRQFEDENRRIREQLLQAEVEAAEARSARLVAEARAALVEELERKNKELEAFSYSVSHDLRAPLRGIDGFSQALLEDFGDKLDARGRDYLGRVRAAAQRMGMLIDDMLELSRVGRAEIRREVVDLTALSRAVAQDLQRATPQRQVQVLIEEGLEADVDPRLVRVLLQNLLENALKFTARTAQAKVELTSAVQEGQRVFSVKDNGAGFAMAYAGKLFAPFQRLHSAAEFPGTGIGLATVQRIVDRHGGRAWAEGEVGKGAAFHFTLPPPRPGRIS